MGFRENLIKKMEIDRLAEQVRRSLAPSEGPQRIDGDAMRALLEMSRFQHLRERDLDLYVLEDPIDGPLVLVLDNGLGLYRTGVEDVALRKSPTLKEMVKIRNAIKILNDKDVVLSRKTDTLDRVLTELIDALDLSFTAADIEAMATDGQAALRNNYGEGVVEIMALFCELLGFKEAPKPFQVPHHLVWGESQPTADGRLRMAPIILFDRMHNRLKMITALIETLEKDGMAHWQQVVKGEAKADLEGAAVFDALAEQTLSRGNPAQGQGSA
ncbi:hypothetical protein [Desulfatitalea alkaliphila]|uniref:Uncharacterized protein n=1 Tax=Desulfatitalea alkaliphila TaxID=2929485 RepID=A0AA41R3T6_9BACT|nr:hypothetical protein [Desulfatitalea alkaliphila]MCJ8501819.1 hypothetical protein [Desulfatitalea alkaliphila]